MTLFRTEVHQAQAAQWLGSVRLHRPLSFAVLTTAALGLALALMAFAAWGEVNRKARLSGLLVPSLGSLSLTAQQSGVLRQLPIAEGQVVKAGDVLLVLHTERQSLLNGTMGDTTERAAQQILARQQSLSAERTLRQLQARQREDVLADRIRTLQALQGERSALSVQLQTDLNQIERNRSSLDQEMSENAARQSTVIALNLKLGQSVQSGQTLATLVPLANGAPGPQQAPLQAQLFAPSHTAGFVRPGQTVYLRYDAYPYQKFGLHTGRITTVSATPFAPSELPANLAQQLVAQAGSNEALYRINV